MVAAGGGCEQFRFLGTKLGMVMGLFDDQGRVSESPFRPTLNCQPSTPVYARLQGVEDIPEVRLF